MDAVLLNGLGISTTYLIN